MFETISFHLVKPCNMKCKFCYATFNDFKVNKQLPIKHVQIILSKLKNAGLQKVTFAGGEPMLYKDLTAAIKYAKSIGLTTSIITNGSLLTEKWIDDMKGHLDWIGLSIDSFNAMTNHEIGRFPKGGESYAASYFSKAKYIQNAGMKLKINTVVNHYNHDENMQNFISKLNPDRWKIFQTLKVEGQNDEQFEAIKCSEQEFLAFVERHSHPNMVVEDNELMTGSYLLVDPIGRCYENSNGSHTYSPSLISHSVEECLSHLNLNRERFIKRGGVYAW